MKLVDRVRECESNICRKYVLFFVDGVLIGKVLPRFSRHIAKYSDVFAVNKGQITFSPEITGYANRTIAMACVLKGMRADGLVPGWRDELYPVGTGFHSPAFFEMERAAVPLFGVRSYGVHMNGWLKNNNRSYMWIARRSLTKPTGPGKLDQMVAGGQPAGMSLRDNLIKECEEEAGIPRALAVNARSVGIVSYQTTREEGLRNDVLFNFDLEVPLGFEPVNNDGEVAAFMLWEIREVIERLNDTEDFKFNSALVIIDFLIRHGFIDSDDPDYSDIVSGLRI